MLDLVRFRIRPECLASALMDFGSVGVEPDSVEARPDGDVAVEFHNLTDEYAALLVRVFKPEYSAIIGVIGGPLFED